jgi:4-carboxymuconolactone decarboxylase
MSEPQDERRTRGLEMMRQVYGWDVQDAGGGFFGMTVDHLFGDVWANGSMSVRDRRLLLIGALAATNVPDILGIQLASALKNDELDADALREIGLLLTHYIGWPLGTKLNAAIETEIQKYRSHNET